MFRERRRPRAQPRREVQRWRTSVQPVRLWNLIRRLVPAAPQRIQPRSTLLESLPARQHWCAMALRLSPADRQHALPKVLEQLRRRCATPIVPPQQLPPSLASGHTTDRAADARASPAYDEQTGSPPAGLRLHSTRQLARTTVGASPVRASSTYCSSSTYCFRLRTA